MIKNIEIEQFKSLARVGPIRLAPFTVMFGPNAAGKSNLLDAIQLLSRLASERTVADALGDPIRGRPLEAFTLPESGLPGLLEQESCHFKFSADITTHKKGYRYVSEIAIRPASGVLSVRDEYLSELSKEDDPKGAAIIEKVPHSDYGSVLRIRRRKKRGHPREEQIGLKHTLLSDERYSGDEYEDVARVREELSSWRAYYLDPRVSMRSPQPPREVSDIGSLGEYVAPFLYRLKDEHPKRFDAVSRTIRSLIPSIQSISVDLDSSRGVLDIMVRQGGAFLSSRIVSEGTLRVLALACIAVNPWGGSLIAFEEPENGVHPRRIELVAELLLGLATNPVPPRQVIVTTHSPLFCNAVINRMRQDQLDRHTIALFNVVRRNNFTEIIPFDPTGPLFQDAEIIKGLSDSSEDGIFEQLVLRGLVDE